MIDRLLESDRRSEDRPAFPWRSARTSTPCAPWSTFRSQEREAVRAALATTMIKSEAHRPAFDALFDIYLGAGPADTTDVETRSDVVNNPQDFRDQLANAIMSGDGAAIRTLAERAVMTFGRVEDSPSGSLLLPIPGDPRRRPRLVDGAA